MSSLACPDLELELKFTSISSSSSDLELDLDVMALNTFNKCFSHTAAHVVSFDVAGVSGFLISNWNGKSSAELSAAANVNLHGTHVLDACMRR